MTPPPAAIGRGHERQLRLDWPDQRTQWLDYVQLRRQCPCSQCRAFRLQGTPPKVSEGIRVIEIHPQGYGVQLVFSDGHQRGIYPWAYLAQMGDE